MTAKGIATLVMDSAADDTAPSMRRSRLTWVIRQPVKMAPSATTFALANQEVCGIDLAQATQPQAASDQTAIQNSLR